MSGTCCTIFAALKSYLKEGNSDIYLRYGCMRPEVHREEPDPLGYILGDPTAPLPRRSPPLKQEVVGGEGQRREERVFPGDSSCVGKRNRWGERVTGPWEWMS